MTVPQPIPNDGSLAKSYNDWLSNFTSDICGNLACSWIRLFEPELNYSGVRPVWWPQGIPWMNPRHMLKKGMIIIADWILKANEMKTKLHFSAIYYADSCLNDARESTWR